MNGSWCLLTPNFGTLLALSRYRRPSVIVLHRAPHDPDAQAGLLHVALIDLEGPLAEGATVSLSPGRPGSAAFRSSRKPGPPAAYLIARSRSRSASTESSTIAAGPRRLAAWPGRRRCGFARRAVPGRSRGVAGRRRGDGRAPR
jgi:hypothetical protein